MSTVFVAGPAFYGYGYYDPFFWGYPGLVSVRCLRPYDRPYYYDNIGSARIQVTPKNAEVYVDSYLVGTVDDFDDFQERVPRRRGVSPPSMAGLKACATQPRVG